MNLTTQSGIQKLMTKYEAFRKTLPYKSSEIEMSENCTGHHILDSKNCQVCFDTTDTEDSKYLQYSVGQDKNDQDCSYLVDSTISYENMSVVHSTHCLFNDVIRRECENLYYCDNCFTSSNCFGCIGLRNKSYCILNRQYTKEEYESLLPKIIAHMTSSKERGEFFPVTLSPFAYNETMANEYFPLNKGEAIQR